MYLFIYLDANFVQCIFIFIQHFFQNFEEFFFIINLSIYWYSFLPRVYVVIYVYACMYFFETSL